MASCTIFVAKPLEMTYDGAMAVLRLWLAERKLRPYAFHVTADGELGFKLSFSSEQDGTVLNEFRWPSVQSSA